MDDMSAADREKFIHDRVRSILEMYESEHPVISRMSPHERDKYVHARVERDLAASQAIGYKLSDYVQRRSVIWRDLILLDIIALVVFGWIALHDLRDAFGFLFILGVMVISRIINFRQRRQAAHILELMQEHLNRETQTATLDFLVDEIDIVNGDVAKMRVEIDDMVKNIGEVPDDVERAGRQSTG